MFLRINTSMEDENLKLDKLVVQATCWDCKRPLHSVKGDVTVFLQGKLIMSVFFWINGFDSSCMAIMFTSLN